jgi:hypothetical protein
LLPHILRYRQIGAFLDGRHRGVARSFTEKQLTSCLDPTEADATLATSYDAAFAVRDDEIHKTSQRLQELYRGSSATVEDDGVTNAMIAVIDPPGAAASADMLFEKVADALPGMPGALWLVRAARRNRMRDPGAT